MPTDPTQVLLKDATLEQIVQAISAKIEAKDLNYSEEELAAASKNIKAAIIRINYAWNFQNSLIFRLPDHLILRIFEHLQGLAHEIPSESHRKWWNWLKVASVCRSWRRISIEEPSLWQNVYLRYKMPVSFLDSALGRTGGRQLAIYIRSCDYLRSTARREGYLKAIRPILNRVKSLTIRVTASARVEEEIYLPNLFAIPHQNLESLDLSFNAFYDSHSSHGRNQPSYQPDVSDPGVTVVPLLFPLIPADSLKHLTLRYMKGWPSTRFRNLTDLTLFGYVDGAALAEAVPANPALRKLKLESIKGKKHQIRHSWDSTRPINLDGQTLELARCEPGILKMFTLSSTCSLVIAKTVHQPVSAWIPVPEPVWLPQDISAIRCLHELEEVRFSVTKTPGRDGWIAAEQKTVGYSTSKPTSGTGPEPSVTFALTYHFCARRPTYKVPFEPKYLLPRPVPWAGVTRASFDGFHGKFGIHDNIVFQTLPNLRSLVLCRCDNSLVPLIAPAGLRSLESLRFEDGLSGANFGETLLTALDSRQSPPGLRLKDLKIVMSGVLSSMVTAEQIGKLGELVDCAELVTKAPGYRSVV